MGAKMVQKAAKVTVKHKVHQEQALELRKAGLSYGLIAKTMGMSKSQAAHLVELGLTELNVRIKETSEAVRELELQRLDAIVMAHWVNRGIPKHAGVILSAMDRRAKYLGLDAPAKVDNTNHQEGEIKHKFDWDALPVEDVAKVVEIMSKTEGVPDVNGT